MSEGQTGVADALRRALAAHHEVDLAIFFGSRARGDGRADSDVDVAVRGGEIDAAALAAELSSVVGHEVDVVPLGDAGIPLLQRLIAEGITVHEREPGVAAAWRTATLLALEIDGPWYRRMADAFLARVAETGI